MKIVYVDDMFVLNLIINYFVILATAKVCALPLKRLRFLLSAILGALYAVLQILPSLRFLESPIMKLCLGALMTLIAFGGAKRLLLAYITFLSVSVAFGGAVFAASMLAGGSIDSALYINVPFRVLLLSFAMCYFALTLGLKRLGRKRARETLEVQITLCEKTAVLRALRDTGNELYDPLSGLPVMVADLEAALHLLPETAVLALNHDPGDFIEQVSREESLKTRFRLVPYSAVGLKSALLPVFRPDGLMINGRREKNVLVGLTTTTLCPDGEFSAIL